MAPLSCYLLVAPIAKTPNSIVLCRNVTPHVAEFINKLPAKLDILLINQYNSEFGRGVRVVNGTALEKRCCRKATVGSNPTLSAMIN